MNYYKTMLFSLLLLFTSASWAQTLGGNFSLTDQHGQRFELQQLRGKVIVLFFGFTHCPSVCPDSLAKIKAAVQAHPREQVVALFITVDPERDSVERIKAYLEPLGQQFIGLTGRPEMIKPVLDAYQIRVKTMKKTPEDQQYMIDHSADIYVLDRDGKITHLIPYGLPAEHLQQVVQAQLAAPQKSAQVTQDFSPALSIWQVTDLTGKQQDFSQFQGQALVINFWASWCPPCRKELPSLNQAQARLKDANIQMLAVNIGDKPAAVQQFLADYPIEFRVWLDENASSFKAWAVKGLPTTLLIQKDGKVRERIVGERDWADENLLAQIRALNTD